MTIRFNHITRRLGTLLLSTRATTTAMTTSRCNGVCSSIRETRNCRSVLSRLERRLFVATAADVSAETETAASDDEFMDPDLVRWRRFFTFYITRSASRRPRLWCGCLLQITLGGFGGFCLSILKEEYRWSRTRVGCRTWSWLASITLR